MNLLIEWEKLLSKPIGSLAVSESESAFPEKRHVVL
jgi:hypothetical protein